jgi:hypothetical protein
LEIEENRGRSQSQQRTWESVTAEDMGVCLLVQHILQEWTLSSLIEKTNALIMTYKDSFGKGSLYLSVYTCSYPSSYSIFPNTLAPLLFFVDSRSDSTSELFIISSLFFRSGASGRMLATKHKALSSNPIPAKQNKTRNNKTKSLFSCHSTREED